MANTTKPTTNCSNRGRTGGNEGANHKTTNVVKEKPAQNKKTTTTQNKAGRTTARANKTTAQK